MRVFLKHRETHATTPGILCAITPDYLSRAQSTWSKRFATQGCATGDTDDHLLWDDAFAAAALTRAHELPMGYAILSPDRVEGMIVLSPVAEPSRKDMGGSLISVRYLATAPWNRDGVNRESGHLGVGRLLLARAVLDSVARGHNGRIGIQSHVSARGYFESLGFDSVAEPGCREMIFYELRPESTLHVLAELGAHLVHIPKIV